MQTIEQRKEKLETQLHALKKTQEAYRGKDMPQSVADQWEADAAALEAEQKAIDAEIQRTERVAEFEQWGTGVPEPTLPETGEEVKAEARRQWNSEAAGYMTLGSFVTAQPVWQKFMEQGAPGGQFPRVDLKGHNLLGLRRDWEGNPLVPITRDQRKTVEAELELKVIPTIGAGVIEPSRLPGVTRVTEDDELTLRDVISVIPTGTDAVQYWRRSAQTRAAAPTAPNVQKPEGTLSFDNVTANVRTIAAWIPVTTQQLADWPQVRGEIDNFLLYDLGREEEHQLLYGDGTGQNLEGITIVAGTTDIAVADARITTPTLIDQIMVGITEVRTAGYRANAVVAHPIDWEAIVLLKSTTNEYIWAVVQTEQGLRMWGVRIVVAEGALAERGDTTEERSLIVGDWRRGAFLADRMSPAVMIGLDGSDFTTNRRTILAEERVALANRAPAAFAILQTVAPVV